MPNSLSLEKMCQLIRSRRISAVELIEAHLRQIERLDPELKAFVVQFREEARAAARRADQEHSDKPLLGIPITVKDSFDMQGLPTYCGSRLRLDHRAEVDSTAVRRLRSAGAVILGKTNCPEFLANYETDNHITGWTANPWNPARSAGGSSGGESAAIASFCSAGGIGSDGGGSIRVPAHFCGIAGLKPTPGRVSAAGHFPQISHPGGLLGVAGPMARTVADVKLLFDVLTGYDPADPFSAPVSPCIPEVGKVRVGVVEKIGGIPVQDCMRDAVRKAARLLATLGISVDPFEHPDLERASHIWWFFFTELMAPFTRDLLEKHEADFHWTGTELLHMVPADRRIEGREVVEKLGLRDRMRAELLGKMEQTRILLLPVCGVPAFSYREREWQAGGRTIGLRDAMAPATPFNLFGFPALAVPFDVTAEGLPVGIQLVGRPWEEDLLLELGARLEEARGAFPSPPEMQA